MPPFTKLLFASFRIGLLHEVENTLPVEHYHSVSLDVADPDYPYRDQSLVRLVPHVHVMEVYPEDVVTVDHYGVLGSVGLLERLPYLLNASSIIFVDMEKRGTSCPVSFFMCAANASAYVLLPAPIGPVKHIEGNGCPLFLSWCVISSNMPLSR
jgi:hypothetical protein